MTVSNVQAEALDLPELPSAESHAQSAQRARSLPLAPVEATPDTPAGDAKSRVRAFFGRVSLPEGSPLHARPLSLRESRASHHEAARRWEAGLIRWPRMAWGYLHLAIRSVLLGTDWVLATPSRFIVTLAVLAAVYLWH